MTGVTALTRHFARVLDPLAQIEAGWGAEAIAADDRLLQACTPGGATRLRLWTNSPCLVATRRLAHRPSFRQACAASIAEGWPVHVRASGGTTVVHRSGVLNVSLVFWIPDGRYQFSRHYGALVELLSGGMQAIGLPADAAAAPGSYCDGAFNICIGGRKVAGLACRVRRGPAGGVSCLAHACITIEGDVRDDVRVVSCFERALGLSPQYDAGAHTSIAAALRERRQV